MTDEDDQMLENESALMGATLLLERSRPSTDSLLNKMERVPVCAVCPAARWYKLDDDKLECFCVEYRGTMYDAYKKVAVTTCDARADALKRLAPAR